MALDLTDKTSNSNDLTNSGAAEYTSDSPFAASTTSANFSSADPDFMEAADSASLDITGDLTIEAYLKPTTNPAIDSGVYVLSKWRSNGSDRSYGSYFYNNNGTMTMRFIMSDDGAAVDIYTIDHTPTTGSWAHYAWAFDASAAQVIFYKDASSIGTNTQSKTSISAGGAKLLLGAREPSVETDFYNGVIDEVRLWNDIRTSTEISDNYQLELAGTETNLVAYYPFESLAVPIVATTNNLKFYRRSRFPGDITGA